MVQSQHKVRSGVCSEAFFVGNSAFLWISLSSIVAVLGRSSTNTGLET